MCYPRRPELEKAAENFLQAQEERRKVDFVVDNTPDWIRKLQDQGTSSDSKE